jgi:hypothetical protein
LKMYAVSARQEITMRTVSFFCGLLLILVVTVGCNRDSSKTAQQTTPTTTTEQSAAQSQPPAPPPVATEQPAPPAPAPEKKKAIAKKPNPEPVAKQEPPKPPQPVVIVVPAGTVLNVRLDQPISTKTNKAGDTFTATLSEGVMVNGATVVPRGAQLGGVIAEAASAGKMKGSAKLALQLTQLGVGKTPYQISASMAPQESKGRGKRTAVAGAGGAGVGALVGGIAGGGKGAAIGALVGGGAGTVGGAMTGERDISLPVEQALSFKLEQTLKVTLPPPQNAQSATR